MTRDTLEQAKKDLLMALHTALVPFCASHGVPYKNVTDVVEGYMVNACEDFFWEALCEIQEAEEQQARKDERDLRRNSPVVL